MEKYQKNALIIFAGLTAILVLFTAIVLGWHYLKKPPAGPLVPLTPEEMAKKNAEIGVLNEFKQCQSADYKNSHNFGSGNDNFYKIAEIIAKKDKTICDTFQDEFWKNSCLKTYYFYRAILDKNENYCKEFAVSGDSAQNSYELVCLALVYQDSSFCQKIADNYYQTICKAVVGDDKAICDGISGDIIEPCVEFSNTTVTSSISCTISASTAKLDCLNSYYAIRAIIERDVNLCSNITQEKRFNRLYCLAVLSEEPEKAIADFYAENVCIEKYSVFLADIEQDKSWCEKIPLKDSENEKLYNDCLGMVKEEIKQ